MKIGILTFHWAKNYGAVLQTYALQSKLKQLGHEPIIINRQPEVKGLRRLYEALSYKHTWGWKRFDRFSQTALQPQSLLCQTDEQLKAEMQRMQLDAVVVGSDQVWRWRMIGLNYFLDFIDQPNVKKFSYAASFGLSEWKDAPEITKQIQTLLQAFNKISVREATGVDICKQVFNVDAELVLDPTLLHEREFYEKTVLKDQPNIPTRKVVSCILGEETPTRLPQIQQWAKHRNLAHQEIYWSKLDHKVLWKSEESFILHLSVPEWLNAIRCAEYVITNSFHAAVFCILFNKKFIVLDNPSGGSDRIATLLKAVNQEERFCKNIPDHIAENTQPEATLRLLAEKRADSIAFLQSLA